MFGRGLRIIGKSEHKRFVLIRKSRCVEVYFPYGTSGVNATLILYRVIRAAHYFFDSEASAVSSEVLVFAALALASACLRLSQSLIRCPLAPQNMQSPFFFLRSFSAKVNFPFLSSLSAKGFFPLLSAGLLFEFFS